MSASEHAKGVLASPTGTVTFLFSDIEGSTRILETLGPRYDEVLGRHRSILRAAFAAHGGIERGTEGDSFFVAFPDAAGAVAAAADATRGLASAAWPDGATIRVRVGLHTGQGRLVDDDYVGIDVHRAARIAGAAHGGQVLLSESTRILVERSLPAGVQIRDMGEHPLKDLPAPEHLYQLAIEGQPTDFPPIRSLAPSVRNLPAQLPTIVGRERDVEAVARLLEQSPIVTVTGPGGTGKTRLVQEVARTVVGSGPIDVVFVPLAALTDATLIPVEILRALGMDVAAAKDPVERLVEAMRARRTRLVLDNLEQLAVAGPVIRTLLDRVPTLSVLVASQAALHVAGEQEYALQPLALNDGVQGAAPGEAVGEAASPAVRLFVERARAVRADFELDSSNVATVAAICARVDGLPLAIELAAAQVKLLSPAAILERIEDRLGALASRRTDLPERQRTLRATVAWSYDLLGDEERRLFRRLAVFAGGARLTEVEGIARAAPPVPDAIDVLETLVDRSLVRVVRTNDDSRIALLETMRDFGREVLGEAGELEAIQAAHAQLYRDLARQGEPAYYTSSRRLWLDRIAAEHDNLRAALDELAAAGSLTQALDLASDLWRFWQQRGHLIEGRERLDALLAAAERPGAPAVDLLALSRAEEAAGSIRYWMSSDRTHPRPLYERALEHAIASGDRRREAWARYNLAFVFDFIPSSDSEPLSAERADALRTEALALFRELDDRLGIAESLWAMGGNALMMLTDPARARAILAEALPMLEELGDAQGTGWAIVSIGMADALEGRLDLAEEGVLRATRLFTRDGDVAGEQVGLLGLAAIAARRGDDITAIRMESAARSGARAVGADLPGIGPLVVPLEEAAHRLGPDVLERERAVGAAIGAKAMLEAAIGGSSETKASPS
ncbi:MAG TPA: AAA family ATPase [Candidatus Dormibacteraeota bacterium]|nr:AAA family ATPase [Candidatus Dormibacteraeota bacterium]